MVFSSAVVSAKHIVVVLMTYCSDHTIRMYTLLDEDAKSKMLMALKSLLVQENIMAFPSMMTGGIIAEDDPRNHQDEDPVLTRAIQSLGENVLIQDFSQLKLALKSWGIPSLRAQSIQDHNQSIRYWRTRSGGFLTTNEVLTKDAPNIDFAHLKKIFIRDLKLFRTALGQYLEGKIITPPNISQGIYTFLEDENGDYVRLALYNMISTRPTKWELAEKNFSVGLKIKISQPFYKVFVDGTLGIRVDSPAEIYREIQNSNSSFDEIRIRGKELMRSGEYLEALEVYLKGLNSSKIAALLNNRSEAEIKMDQFEEALLDTASVLLFSKSDKASRRYFLAAHKLGFNRKNKTSILAVWKHILQYQQIEDNLYTFGSRDEGNAAFRLKNYEEAKRNYSAALRDSRACILFNNIAAVCLKLEIFHTAISASSACLRMSTDSQVRGKALFCMAKAFALLGEMNLSKLSIECDVKMEIFWKRKVEKLWGEVVDPELKAYQFKRNAQGRLSVMEGPIFNNPSKTWDFILTGSIEHDYIAGRGRGIRAKKEICAHEILLVDHPLEMNQSLEKFYSYMETDTWLTKSPINLVTKILALVKHDGLLGKKILLLETRGKLTEERLPLVDMEWMAYRKFSYDVPPFLPQIPEVVGCNSTNLTQPFIRDVVSINNFGLTEENDVLDAGVLLHLRISLLNHDKNPNCFLLFWDDATFLISKRVIKKGEELTIFYEDETAWWGF